MQKHIKMDANETGRDFVIGDIHGYYDKFMKSLEKINFDFENDRIFSLGDIIDRGPDSVKCIGLLDEPWFECIMGNHEEMFIMSIRDSDYLARNIHLNNGGEWILGLDMKKLAEYVEKLATLPISITLDTPSGLVGMVHADPVSEDWNDVRMGNVDQNHLLWSRSQFSLGYPKQVENVYMTYHGHTPTPQTKEVGNSRYIDTGIYGNFTIVQLN